MKRNFTLNTNKIFGLKYSFFILLYLIISIVFSGVLLAFNGNNFVITLLSPLGYSIAILLVIYTQNKLTNTTFKLIKKPNFSIKFTLLAVCLSVGMFFGLGGINFKFAEFLQGLNIKVSSVSLDLSSLKNYILYSIMLCVVPAVMEELFFRRFLIDNISGNHIVISLIVGLLFGLYHAALSQLIYQLICGFFLTMLALKSKSVLPCILAHFLNNFLVITFEFFGVIIDFYSWKIVSIGLVFLVAFMVAIFIDKERVKGKGNYLQMIGYSSVGIAFLVVLIVAGCF